MKKNKSILKVEKTPLGIEPKNIWLTKRADALCAAIARYREARKPVNEEWYEELNEILTIVKNLS
jgi:hypothetical protein